MEEENDYAALITNLVVTVPSAATGSASTITIAVDSGTEMTLFMVLGDGIGQEVDIADPSSFCPVEHTYPDPGKYNITVMLSNTRSSEEVTVEANVQDPITGVTMAVTDVAVGEATTITITATGGTGMIATVVVGSDTLHEYCFDTVGDLAPFDITLAEGSHSIVISLSNGVTTEEETLTAIVYTAISGPSLTVAPLLTDTSTAIIFTQIFTSGTQVACTRDFGDGTTPADIAAADVSVEDSWTHTYTAIGEHTFTLTCSNLGQTIVIRRSIFITAAAQLTMNDPSPVALADHYVGFTIDSDVSAITATLDGVDVPTDNVIFAGNRMLPAVTETLGPSATTRSESYSSDLDILYIVNPGEAFSTPGRLKKWQLQETSADDSLFKLSVVRRNADKWIIVDYMEVTSTVTSYEDFPVTRDFRVQAGDMIGFIPVERNGVQHTSGACSTSGELPQQKCVLPAGGITEGLQVTCEALRVDNLCTITSLTAEIEQDNPTAYMNNVATASSASCSVSPAVETSADCAVIFDGIIDTTDTFFDLSTTTPDVLGVVTLTIPSDTAVSYIKILQSTDTAHSIENLRLTFTDASTKDVTLRRHFGTSSTDSAHLHWDYIPIVPAVTTTVITFTPLTFYDQNSNAGFLEVAVYTDPGVSSGCDEVVSLWSRVSVPPAAYTDPAQCTGFAGSCDGCYLGRGAGLILLPASMQQRGDFEVVVTATGLVGPSSIVTKTHTFVQSIDRGSVNIVRTPDISEANTADTSFCVTVGLASHLTYGYEFGDGATDDTTTSTLPEDATPVCTTHQFGVGTFTTTLTLSNVAGSEIFTVDIESLQPLGTVTANYNADYDLSSGSFELVIDLTSDSPAIPTAVHCDVAFKDGLSAVDHLLTGFSGNTLSDPITYDYEVADIGPQTISISCYNAVSARVELTETIEVYQPISSITLTVDPEFVAVGSPVTFGISYGEGSHVTSSIDQADGESPTVLSFTSGPPYLPDPSITSEYMYNTAGNFTAVLTASSTVSTVPENFPEVIVQQVVPQLTMTTDESSVACPPGVVTVTIAKLNPSDPDPSDIFVTWSVPGLISTSHYTTLPHSQELALSCLDAGEIIIAANVSNLVSVVTVDRTITVQAVIENPVIQLTQQFVATDEVALFEVTLDQGSHVEFNVSFGDGSDPINFPHSNVSYSTISEQFNHTYTVSGNYTITLTASNDVTDTPVVVEASEQIVVQKSFDVLELTTDITPNAGGVYVLPEGGTVTAQLAVPPDNDGLASNVHMEWKWIEDDSEEPEFAYTEDLQQTDDRQFEIPHSYTTGELGEQVISVRCWNQVSSKNVTTSIIIEQPISGVTITANLEFGTSPLWYGSVNVPITMDVTSATGSDIGFSLSDGVNTSPTTWQVIRTESGSENVPYQHSVTYSMVGEYTITAEATNNLATTEITESVTIITEVPITDSSYTVDTAPSYVLSTDSSHSVSLLLADGEVEPSSVNGMMKWNDEDYGASFAVDSYPHPCDINVAGFSVGTYASVLKLSNHISLTEKSFTFVVMEPLGSLTLVLSSDFVSTDRDFDLVISLSGGTDFDVTVQYGEGTEAVVIDDLVAGTDNSQTHSFAAPGEYDILVTVTNKLGQVVSEPITITVQQPFTADDFNVDTNLLSMITPDSYAIGKDQELTITISNVAPTVPTGLIVTINYGDESAVSETPVDISADFVAPPHIYDSVSVVTLTVSVHSAIVDAVVIWTGEVNVQELIDVGPLQMKPFGDAEWSVLDSFSITSELVFNLPLLSGSSVQLEWFKASGTADAPGEFEQLLSTTTDVSTELVHTFTTPGAKIVKVNAKNDVMNRETFIYFLSYSLSEVDTLEVTPNPVMLGETITYFASIKKNDASCFFFQIIYTSTEEIVEQFWIGTGEEPCRKSQQHLGINFRSGADYFTQMTGLSGTREGTLGYVGLFSVKINFLTMNEPPFEFTQSLTVTAIPCEPPTATTKVGPGDGMDNPVAFKSSNINSIGIDKIDTTIDCQRTNELVRKWSMSLIDDVTGEVIAEVPLNNTKISTGDAGITFQSAVLTYGLYRVGHFVYMKGSMDMNDTAVIFARVVETPLEISISGKEAQTIGSNAELLVDAESYLIDPDNENKEVEYQFSCAVKGEVVDETRIITVPTDSDPVNLPSSPNGCFGTGPAILDVSGAGKFQFNAKHVLAPATYEISVKVTKGNREASNTLELEVVPGNPPEIALMCKSKPNDICSKKISAGEQIELWAASLALSAGDIPTYTWTACVDQELTSDGYDTTRFNSDKCLTNIEVLDVTYNGLPASRVTIQPMTLPEGVVFTLNVRISVPGRTEGRTGQTFQTNKSPSGGSCRVTPESGIARHEFSLICTDWQDDQDANIYDPLEAVNPGDNAPNIRFTHESSINGQDIQEYFSNNPYLGKGDPNNNYRLDLKTYIIDDFGDKSEFIYFVTVEPNTEPPEIPDDISTMDTTQALSLISTLATDAGKDDSSSDGNGDDGNDGGDGTGGGSSEGGSNGGGSGGQLVVEPEVRRSSVVTTPPVSEQDAMVAQLAVNLADMLSDNSVNSNPEQLTAVFAATAGVMTSRTSNYPAAKQSESLDLASQMGRQVEESIENLSPRQAIELVSNVMTFMSSNVDVVPATVDVTLAEPLAEEALTEEQIEANQELIAQQAAEAKEIQKKLAESIAATTNTLTNAMSKSLTINGAEQTVETPSMSLTVQKSTADSLSGATYSSSSGGVALPDIASALGNGRVRRSTGNTSEAFLFSYAHVEKNFLIDDTDAVSSGVSTLAISNDDGEKSNLNLTAAPVQIALKVPDEIAGGSLNSSAIYSTNDTSYVYLPVDSEDSAMVFDMNFVIGVLSDITVYVLKGLNDSAISKPGPNTLENPRMNDCNMTSELQPGNSTWASVIPQDCVKMPGVYLGITIEEQISSRRRRSLANEMHVTKGRVIRHTREAESPNGNAPMNETMENGRIRTISSRCRSWNKTASSWSSQVCKVSEGSSPDETTCECNELSKETSDFGGGFVMPAVNPIDFGKVFGDPSQLLSNPAVLCTVLAIGLMYVLIGLWARRADLKDKETWTIVPMSDNNTKHTYYYKVSIYTGLRKGAGTLSNAYFVINGEDGDTGVRVLSDGKNKGFKRGAVKHFMMSAEENIGELLFVRIWHDNSGKGENAGWFLDKICVEDIQGKTRYFFLCGRWLSVDEDDSLTDRILSVAGQEQVNGFGHVFFSTARKNLTDDHLWLSVVSRPTRSNFTRLQRLTCGVTLLYATMIANMMYFGVTEAMEGTGFTLKVGPIEISSAVLMVTVMSSLTVIPINVIIMQLFRKSKTKKEFKVMKNNKMTDSEEGERPETPKQYYDEGNDPEKGKKLWKRKYPLPYWCVYIGYVLAFMTSFVSSFFCVLYGLEWGKAKSERWLSALVLSVVQSTVIVQPIKVVLLAMVISCIFKKLQEDDNEELEKQEVEALKAEVEELDDEDDLANDPVLMLDRKYNVLTAPEPPSKEKLRKLREEREYNAKVRDMIKEFGYYSLYVCLISFIAFGQRDEMSYTMNNGLINMIGYPQEPNQTTFTKVNDGHKFWTWLEDTALPATFFVNKYNGDYTTMRERNYTDDMVSFRVGPLRLRQVRVKEGSCNLNNMMKKFVIDCNSKYSMLSEQDRNYTVGWFLSNGTDLPEEITSLDKAYLYKSMIELRGLPYLGIMATYGGGGYVAELGGSQLRAKRLLNALKENDWIDFNTRAVFLEFTVYNPNVNLFSYINFVMEFPATGGVMANPRVMTFQVFSSFTAGGMKTVVIMAQILFVIIMTYMFIRECIKIYRLRKKYFLDFWNMFDLGVIAVSATCVGMFALREIWGRLVLSEISENKDEYINYLHLATYDELLMYMLGLVLFLAIIKLLRLLRFNKHVWTLVGTLIYARYDLMCFGITFFIFMFAFATLGQVVFGATMLGFSSFIRTLESLYSMLLGKFAFNELAESDRLLGPLYFVGFVIMMFFIIINMFLGILADSFTMMKSSPATASCDYQVVDYLINQFKGYLGKTPAPSKEQTVQIGEDGEEIPVQTQDEYIDAVETLQRRLTSIDRYLTNDYIEEHLFSRNKDLIRQNQFGTPTKQDAVHRKNVFKKLLS